MSITLRPVSQDDEAFLYQLYSQAHIDELGARDWDANQQQFFLRMQFNAQQRFYQSEYPDADYSIILLDQRPVGWIVIARMVDEMLVVDIALLPEYRNTGIGTLLLQGMQAEAAQTGKRIHLHVTRFNPAIRLYERSGFSRIGETGMHFLMEWKPPKT
ncbi:MAG TPA: GNAT family N-acetyltransferase [Ktedonobacteraceae bacterium]|nr:GNAT family N-acetyltransferase [Ktedonobacteraceae bacterium]